MKTAQEIYDEAVKSTPRSAEWKAGALAGLQRREAPHVHQYSPYKGATAQDDAWRAGIQYGLELWKWHQQAGAAA